MSLQIGPNLVTCCVSNQIKKAIKNLLVITIGKLNASLNFVDSFHHRLPHGHDRLRQITFVGRLTPKNIPDHFFDQDRVALGVLFLKNN